ncbi:MAG TPA: C39 family peptidase [Vicinamibacterales bacterium]|nr:C39 family peptidase [Vicinamibacterales bacterium]
MLALAAALSIAVSATTTRLDVPYVPQTPALCGGAAAAMVFRYWGDTHANVEPFAPLVDRRAGGIATGTLVDAIRDRHWLATPFTGNVASLVGQLNAAHPVILLIEDRPRAYHYVVAIGTDETGVVVHDPAWGPSRHLDQADFEREWKGAGFWSLLVLPTATTPFNSADASIRAQAPESGGPSAGTACDRLMRVAVADIGRRGLDAADEALGAVRDACPNAAAPLAELAGVRFAQMRYAEASDLATQATQRDESNTYAWDVLGSSRFMLDDSHGALAAWNRIGKPRIDSVSITGLTRTRYQLVTEALELKPDTLLTLDKFRLAERRLEQLPDQSHARIGFVPKEDGYAVVDVAIAEQAPIPRSLGGVATLAVNAAVNREVTAAIPGGDGQGEIWSATWRWWQNRPGVAFQFAAPRVGPLPGTWHVDAAWAAQTFAASLALPTVRENQLHAGVGMTNWFSNRWRYELAAGADSWDSSRRAASIGATLERRGNQDRLTASATVEHWVPLFASASFSRALLTGSFRSSNELRGFVDSGDIGLETVTGAAPMSLWPGAGDGHARAPLLRAHPLLVDGIVTGPVFGRHVAYANNELTRWINRIRITHAGVAGFVDAATASDRMAGAQEKPFQVDVGAGVRLGLPGGTLRVDYAHGLRDGRDSVTVGFISFR